MMIRYSEFYIIITIIHGKQFFKIHKILFDVLYVKYQDLSIEISYENYVLFPYRLKNTNKEKLTEVWYDWEEFS